jgi:hypothetical protein
MKKYAGWGVVAAVASVVLLAGCAGGPWSDPGEMEMAPVPAEDVKAVDVDREIIRTATMSVRVDDVRADVGRVEAITASAGGWIASENVDSQGDALFADITVRVPAAELDGVMGQVAELGTVTWRSVGTEDVTAQGIDLDARIEALRTSITRLEELLAQAASTKDLIDIEGELTTRQAELDSLVAQRAALSEAVAMSTLSVSLTPAAEAAEWTAPGFLAGLQSGWNVFVALLAGLVTMAGFVLPFLAALVVIAIPVGVIILILRRRARG